MTQARSVEIREEAFRGFEPRLRILIPAYNEGSRIAPMLEEYCAHFDSTAMVTVIANACTDDTVQVIERLMQRFRNLQLIVINGRIGKGGAIRAGLNIGREPYVGFADADGSTSAAEFARLYAECLTQAADGIIGSRWLPSSVVLPRQSFRRRLASRAFNLVVRVLFGLPFADTQCGAKVFRREAIRAVLPSLELANFAFDIDLLFNLKRAGFRVIEVPTRWSDRLGTKVRFVASSIGMLQAVIRLRLRESWLLRLPFADMFARGAVIPVREGTRVLVIADRWSRDAWAERCLQELESRGCRLTWNEEVAPTKLRLIWWYLFKSHRRYDAIIEVASGVPALIPIFSAKRCFLLQNVARRSKFATGFFSAIYRPVHRIHFTGTDTFAYAPLFGRIPFNGPSAEATARYIWEQIGAGVLYRAEFQHIGDTWDLRFSDMTSGSWTLQSLK